MQKLRLPHLGHLAWRGWAQTIQSTRQCHLRQSKTQNMHWRPCDGIHWNVENMATRQRINLRNWRRHSSIDSQWKFRRASTLIKNVSAIGSSYEIINILSAKWTKVLIELKEAYVLTSCKLNEWPVHVNTVLERHILLPDLRRLSQQLGTSSLSCTPTWIWLGHERFLCLSRQKFRNGICVFTLSEHPLFKNVVVM